jgi:sugar/nucleoside kinase (ribokinase family)
MTRRQTRNKIAVVGTVNRDTIHRSDGSRVDGYGGVLYNLRTLCPLFADRATIYPVVKIGRDHRTGVYREFAEFANLSLEAVRTVPRANNRCLLRYDGVSEKSEILRGWVGAVDRRQLRPILDCDLVLINFISGGDISRRNLAWFRRCYNGIIFMDLHSRTLGRRRNGRRFLRVPPRWRDYVAGADILQMNRTEFQLLHGRPPERSSCRSFFLKHLRRCRALAVTIGERGCLLTYGAGKSLRYRQVTPAQQPAAVDTTGCGDVFSGAFIYALMMGRSLPECAAFAVDSATYAAAQQTIDDLDFRRFRLDR